MHVYVLFMRMDICPFPTQLILLKTISGEALFLSQMDFFGALNITCELPSSSIVLESMQKNCTTVKICTFDIVVNSRSKCKDGPRAFLG